MGPTSKTKPKQDWVPTEPAFRRFLEWLDEGQDSNGERYFEMRRRLVRYFDHKQCVQARLSEYVKGSRHFPKSLLHHAHPKERAREIFANSRDPRR
jgi:hypothetical protein